MAQVKKFQPGGVLTVNGKTYTPEQINEFLQNGGFSSRERAALAETVNSIADGKARELDANANQILGEEVLNDFVDFYGGRVRRAEKNIGRNSRWANRQARRNSDHHAVNSAISKLGGITEYFNKKEEAEIPLLDRKTGTIAVDQNGNYLKGASNDYNQQYITNVYDYITGAKKFKLGDNWGNNMDILKAWKDRTDLATFLSNLETNNLSPAERDALQRMGLTFGAPKESKPTHHPDFKGNRDLADRLGIVITKDEDGNWVVTGNEAYTKGTWYDDAGLFDGTDFARGGIYNGKIFTRQQIINDDIGLQDSFDHFIQTGTNAGTYDDWWNGISQGTVKFIGNPGMQNPFATSFNPNAHYNEYWQEFFSDKNLGEIAFNVSDLTSAYTNSSGKQIIAYIDPQGGKDDLSMFYPKFVVRNANGDYKQYNSEQEMIVAEGLTPKHNQNYVGNGSFQKEDFFDIKNKQYAIYKKVVTSGNQENIILIDKDNKVYLAVKKDGEYQSPLEIKDEAMFNKLMTNPSSITNDDLDTLTGGFWRTFKGGDVSVQKFGGKIKSLPQKFQYGGSTAKVTTETKTTNIDEAKSDYSSTHKANSSDGGLTNAEILQIGAAVGDLAGVGISFIPGAHIISGITGLAATGAQFAGDVMKDGFQWGDLGSAAISAGLDIGSFFTGAATKVPKAIKAVRAVAPVIMKLFAANGIITGAQAVGKIVRGEDVTSEDIIDILRGITSTAIGAKMVRSKIGDATLSKKLEDDVLKTKNASAKAKPTATIDGKKIDVETSQIEGKSKTEVEAYLKEKVKAQLGDKFKEGEHDVDLSKKFGISYDKGEFTGLQWKKIFKGKGFIGRGEGRATFEPDEIDEGSSLFWHYIRPGLRRQNLGYDWGFWNNKGRLGNVSESAYKAALSRLVGGANYRNHPGGWRLRLRDEALMRQAMLNPKAFGFDFNKGKEFLPGALWRTQYGRTIKETPEPTPAPVYPAYVTPEVGVRNNFLALPAPAQEVRSIGHQPILSLPAPSRYDMKLMQHSSKSVLPSGESVMMVSPSGEAAPVYSFNTVGRVNWDNKSILETLPKDAAWWSAGDVSSWLRRNGIEPTKDTMNEAFEFISKNRIYRSGGKIDKFERGKKIGSGVGEYIPNSNLQTAAAIMGGLGKAAVKFGVGMSQSTRQQNLARESAEIAKNSLATNAPEYYNNFNDSGIKQTYDNAAVNTESLANNPVSSDPIRNRQFRTAVANEAKQLRAEGDLKQSQAYSTWQNQQNSLRATYANQRTAVENSNRQRAAAADLGLNKELAAGIAQDSGLISGFIGDVTKVLSVPQAAANQEDLIQARNEYSDWLKAREAEYTAWSQDEANKGKTQDWWLEHVYKSPDGLNGIQVQRKYLQNLRQRGSAYQLASITQQKKGGRIRSANDQIKIDNEKARQKAISQLSKQAFELLKKSLG